MQQDREHLTKDCRSEQKMKNKSIQENLDKEDNEKQEDFVGGSEQVQYNKPLYIVNLKIDILFCINEIIRKEN